MQKYYFFLILTNIHSILLVFLFSLTANEYPISFKSFESLNF